MKFRLNVVFEESAFETYNVNPNEGSKTWEVDKIIVENGDMTFFIQENKHYGWYYVFAQDIVSFSVEKIE